MDFYLSRLEYWLFFILFPNWCKSCSFEMSKPDMHFRFHRDYIYDLIPFRLINVQHCEYNRQPMKAAGYSRQNVMIDKKARKLMRINEYTYIFFHFDSNNFFFNKTRKFVHLWRKWNRQAEFNSSRAYGIHFVLINLEKAWIHFSHTANYG